jgi:undecaprenyl-diphosphatase
MIDQFFIFGAKYLWLVSALVALICFLKIPKEEKKKMLTYGAILFGLSFLLSIIAREIYFNPRPFVLGGFEPLIPHDPDNGFPSDHVLLVAALAKFVAPWTRRTALWLWLVTGIVALSRVYAGIHHFADVLASIAIVIVSSHIAYAIIRKLWNKNLHTNSPSH